MRSPGSKAQREPTESGGGLEQQERTEPKTSSIRDPRSNWPWPTRHSHLRSPELSLFVNTGARCTFGVEFSLKALSKCSWPGKLTNSSLFFSNNPRCQLMIGFQIPHPAYSPCSIFCSQLHPVQARPAAHSHLLVGTRALSRLIHDPISSGL